MNVLKPLDLAYSTEPLARRLVTQLRHDIVTMQIKPGEKLSEQALGSRYGVSRQPIREAFIKLAETGLLRVLPQRGTMVVKISLAAVLDARFIREAIECSVVEEAARRGNQATFAQIRRCLDETELAISAANADNQFSLDEQFHQLLAAAAGRPNAWNVIVEQKAQLDRVRYLDAANRLPMQVMFEQHVEIFKCVESRNPEGANRAMRRHLAEILTSLPKLTAQWPDFFDLTNS